MKYNLEFWFFIGDEDKDFDTEIVEADSFDLAKKKLRNNLKFPIYQVKSLPN